MGQRERGSRWTARYRSVTFAIFLLAIIVPGLLVSAPYTAHSQTPEPTATSAPTIGPPPDDPSVSWTGPPKTTDIVGPGKNNLDHYFVRLSAAGTLAVRITWDNPRDNFFLYIYRGHWEKGGAFPGVPKAKNEDVLSGTSKTAVVANAEAGEYTVRVHYFTVVDSDYRGLATFGGGVRFAEQALVFGPATIASAHFLGTEPMVTMERRLLESIEGAIDPDRIFVDWPLTSRGQIGQVSRSLDGGRSFRLLFDPECPERSRPGCRMGGGGDTMTEVDLIDGTLYFADQAVVLGAESLASSTDHGDSFPPLRQFAISGQITPTDRQWLAPVNGVDISVPSEVGVSKVKAFLSYHVPLEGQYIHGIDKAGVPIPQPAPQLKGVLQSGHPRVDTSDDGPGRGWIYQPYLELNPQRRNLFVVRVATVHGSDYQVPEQWKSEIVTSDAPNVFLWLDIDSEGNAYLVWAADDGAIYYSVSPIDHDSNNPNVKWGRPGSFWTPQLRLTPPEITNAIFAEVVAGDRGRIAISYVGTEKVDDAGDPSLAPDTASWNTYAAVITEALQDDGPPEVTTGLVSHRPIHKGNICTGGLLFCNNADRSLADMIDIGVDEDGRIGVVFADNNNSLPLQDDSEKARPFAHFAKLTGGPSLFLFEDKPPIIDVTPPVTGADARLDSTWPNITATRSLLEGPPTYLPALDAVGARLSLEDDEVVARLELETATLEARKQDLGVFEEKSTAIRPAERLHYMVRFATATDVYHLSMESDANGTPTFFGGRLDDNDELRTGGNVDSLVGAAYNDDDVGVTGSIEGNTLVIRAPAAAFGVADGTDVFSVTGFTMGGPAEANVAVFNPMRTVDATPPFDATLSRGPVEATLTYTGTGEGKVGDTVAVSARLATAGGFPLAGRTVSFSRGGKETAAVTGDDGVASTTLHITGPPGSDVPVVVTFDGDASFLPLSIEAPFTAHTGGPSGPRGPRGPRGAV